MLSLQNQVSVVLVETSESLNIGAVSRLMANFDFTDLRLVTPLQYSEDRALITACGATGPLRTLRQFSSLSEAISDCQQAIGFSARTGKNRGEIVSLPQWLERMTEKAPLKTALVFGPEDNGLRQEHVELCSSLVYIPTSGNYPSMNLSHAVGLALYGLSVRPSSAEDGEELATLREYDQLDFLAAQVAQLSGFFHKGTPQPVPSVVKTILRRLKLNQREMAIMLGLFGTAHKALCGDTPIHKADTERG